jgi:TPR repeat protein
MISVAALILLASTPQSSTPVPSPSLGGQDAWIEASVGSHCAAPVIACAQRAFDDRDLPGTFRYLQVAAAKGDVLAMRAIGVAFMQGEGLRRDPQAGVGWLYEAAIRDDREAMRLLGTAFRTGLGVTPDSRLADYWTARARK